MRALILPTAGLQWNQARSLDTPTTSSLLLPLGYRGHLGILKLWLLIRTTPMLTTHNPPCREGRRGVNLKRLKWLEWCGR
ncbi:hypothetical protein TNCV_3301841 [Trichonephila clavipes]|nr:hypothetical protein TNCV_3301841 [Trichonephila clavipes]